ncbi:c-type cytochrome [Flavihumibacter fluvii]|uniref:c-type cytochrome n=1 Tax=Flavihumibacter fluvii TaxID=2838157 RepID=UPI001BDF2BA1|nr:c-type cytochrome [Flavihumibacter fluvii]ULQ53153.1 c-type cytochrome [Flavihumibacter fluvii]
MEQAQDNEKIQSGLISVIHKLILAIVILLIGIVALPFVFYFGSLPSKPKTEKDKTPVSRESPKKTGDNYWVAPEPATITDEALKAQVEYGKDLIAHTAKYFGPKGTISATTNGLNCQNCHLQAGTGVFANNYGSVASLYPKFRARSGKIETTNKRVNDCFERSLDGKALDTTSKEMLAIVAYIDFLGTNVKKGEKAPGSGFKDLAYLDRAADPEKGKIVYASKCQSCHQKNGEGVLNGDKTEYSFPALWGKQSYNDGAGLYRISNFAKYVKYNMPLGATHENPQLTDEEAWDVAAYVNAQKRPHISVPKDWPDKSKKPVDHPFGPYADNFTEKQHKFGPFKPIETAAKNTPKSK